MKKLWALAMEKWAHEGFQRYFRNTGWLLATRVLTMVVGFFVVAVVARYLGPTNYGTLSYAISFVGLFSFIASIGIDSVLYRDLIKFPERENEFLGTSFLLKTFSGLLSVAAVLIALMISPEEPLSRGLIIIISISYLFQAFNIINYSFQAKVQAKFLSITSIVVVIILSLLKLAIVYWGKGVYFLAATYALEPLLYGIFFLVVYKRYYGSPLKWYFNKRTAIEMLKESFPLMLSTVFIIIYSRIDQVMIKHMIDITSVGLYDASVRLSEVWYFLPGIIVSSFYPSIVNARVTHEQMYARRVLSLTLFLVCLSAVIGLIVTLFAKWIVLIVFGASFLAGYHVLQLYIWSGIGISISAVLNQYLVTEKLTRHLLYISLVGMLLNVVFNLLLIPKFGINGSALATLISYIAGPLSILLFKAPRDLIRGMIKSR